MIWEKKEIDPEEVRRLADRYNLDLITASILARREILSPEDISFFLEKDIRYLHNPFLLEGMAEAVERINHAIENREKIMLFGDRDVDGITAIVLMVETLQELGADPEWLLPVGDENYGLTEEVIHRIRESGIDLLITLDCGISNIDEIELANSLDIDSIIIDHHNPNDYLPDALAVINPKLEESEYPFKHLCGCAVACKVVWALHFSRTRYFDRQICLLNLRPANESMIFEAVRMVNLVEQERLIDNIIPGIMKFENSRIHEFVSGNEIYVFDKETQLKLITRTFGKDTDLPLIDVMPPIVRSFPALKNKSLLKIKELSRLARYASRPPGEIDMFRNLIISHVYRSETELTNLILEKMGYVALGTLADIMPLINENRIFVKIGLELLKQSKNRGLKQLLIKQDLYGRKLSSKDIGWNLSPVINAAGRMGEPDKAAQLLLSTDQEEILHLVEYLADMNKQRKNLGEKVWKTIIPKARTCYEKTGHKMVLISGKNIHRGITGIIAARLVKFFRTSAIVIAVLEDKATGSLRSTPNFNAKEFLQSFEDILADFGGHDMAAGFSLPAGKLDDFKNRFYEIAAGLRIDDKQEEKITIDAEIPLSFLKPDLWNIVEMLEPYGECNRSLYFLSRGLKIRNLDFIGKKEQDHVKMLLDTGHTKWPAILWNGAERVGRDFGLNDSVDIVYQINKNFFQNIENLRLTIMDIRKNKASVELC